MILRGALSRMWPPHLSNLSSSYSLTSATLSPIMAPINSSGPETNLQSTLHDLRSLLLTFQQALHSPIPPHPPIPSSPNPLALCSDASSLLKAQTTKLSLLLLNDPFSAKEVDYILTTLSKSVLPALMSALQLCPAEKCTFIVHEHIKSSLGTLWRELRRLLSLVPEDGKGVSEGDGKESKEKDALACTGVLWEQCDTLKQLGDTGFAGLVDTKVKAYGELLEDAIGELEDWDPDEDDSSNGEDSNEEEDGDDDQAGNVVILTPTTSEDEKLEQRMQKPNLSLRNVLKARVLRYLRLIRLLYPAIRKRRVATFPNVTRRTTEGEVPAPEQIEKLGAMVTYMQRFSDDADELAGALYSDDKEAIERRLRGTAENARECVQTTKIGWNGQEDEYSAWIAKWEGRLEEIEKG